MTIPNEAITAFRESPYWPVLLRGVQTALEAAPTLLVGLVVAGVLRGMIRPETIRGWFTSDPHVGPMRASFLGLLLPVCSFGVLPVAWELRRAGVARATVLTFLLSAPLANPLSVAYACEKLATHGSFAVSAFLGILSAAIVVPAGMGILLGRWLPEPVASPPDLPALPSSEWRRVVVAGLTTARALPGIFLLFLFAGLLGSGLLALYPGGALEQAARERSHLAPLRMALVALPFQVAPVQGNLLLGDMLLMQVSFGVAFIFLILGVGCNLGTLVWIAWVYGFRILIFVILVVVGVALALGYAVPLSLPNLPADAAQGRHFLEIEWSGGAEIAQARAVHDTLFNDEGEPQPVEIGTCAVLGILALLGVACRVVGGPATIRYQMTRPSRQTLSPTSSAWNRPLSSPQLALAGLVLVLILAVAALYLFYPPPAAVFDAMNSVQIDLNLALKAKPVARADALRLVNRWQRLQGKLAIGDFLRHGRFDSPLRPPSEELRIKLKGLRAALIEGQPAQELSLLYREARTTATHCRQAVVARQQP